MEIVPDEFVLRIGEAVGAHVRPNFLREALMQSRLHAARPRVGRDGGEGRMLPAERARQELRAEHLSMFEDGQSLRLLVDMVTRCHLMTAGDNPEGLILDGLKATADQTLLDDRPPDPRRVRKRRPDVDLEGVHQEPQLTTPISRRH